jgi:hypothetical protein
MDGAATVSDGQKIGSLPPWPPPPSLVLVVVVVVVVELVTLVELEGPPPPAIMSADSSWLRAPQAATSVKSAIGRSTERGTAG